MQRAATEANRTIAVLSQKYLESSFTQPEWAAAFAQDPQGKKQKLIPVRIAACELTGILAPIVYLDLVGLPENDARTALLGAFSIRNKPASAPTFPGTRTPQPPGASPAQPAYPEHQNDLHTCRGDSVGCSGKGRSKSPPLRLSAFSIHPTSKRDRTAAFQYAVVCCKPPAGLVPPMPAPQGDRTAALLTWAEAPGGCGLSVLQELLDTIVNPQ